MTVEEGRLPVGDTGEYLDTTIVEQEDGVDAHREVVVLGDPDDANARAAIVGSRADSDEYALLFQQDTNSNELFTNILNELRLLNMRFEEAFRTNISKGDI